MKLKISPDLTLDASFVTKTQAVIAKKRVGKSYKAQVQAEELLKNRQQVVVLDPTDVWWGLRSSDDGKSIGFPITILGGRHADMPLDPASGKQWAKAVVKERFSVVFSLKLMSGPERHCFAADFLETLLAENVDAMHLFIDEADIFCPQTPRSKEQTRCLTAGDEIVRRGGVDGIGITLITQRSAVINKDVISQVDMLMVLRMHHDLDIEPVARWIKGKVNKELAADMVLSLHKLPTGEAWIFVPEEETFKRIRFRDKITFDSGRTPRAGERRRAPKVLAPIDLEKIGKTIEKTIQETKDNDPKELKKRLVEFGKETNMRIDKLHSENLTLAAQLANAKSATASAKPTRTKVVEVKQNVINPKQLVKIDGLIGRGKLLIERWDNRSANAFAGLQEVNTQTSDLFNGLAPMLKGLEHAIETYKKPAPVVSVVVPAITNGHSKPAARPASADSPGTHFKPAARPPSADSFSAAHPKKVAPRPISGDTTMAPGESSVNESRQRIIDAIHVMTGLLGHSPRKNQVALFARYSPTSGDYARNLSELRKAELIDYPVPGSVSLTVSGAGKIGTGSEIPRTTDKLHEFVRSFVGESGWKVLDILIRQHPDTVHKKELAELAGLSPTSGDYARNLADLRKYGLVDYPIPGRARAGDVLFIGGGAS